MVPKPHNHLPASPSAWLIQIAKCIPDIESVPIDTKDSRHEYYDKVCGVWFLAFRDPRLWKVFILASKCGVSGQLK